jgi:sugar O-acyltransferase (sialic acid O-acetyltransferase NeuD family)
MNDMVVIGGGGHTKVLISILKRLDYRLLGYTDPMDRGPILGVAYLGGDDILRSLIREHMGCFAAIGLGKVDASAARRALADRVGAIGFVLPPVISPTAIVNEGVDLGTGTVVFDGVVVNSGTVIEGLCILNTSCIVEHDCRLGDNVHVAPGAVVSGGVTVGANTMLGAGSTVVQDVSIVADCMVGAGSTVAYDLESPGTYVGSPARRIH